MGIRNRDRRRAKLKARARRGPTTAGGRAYLVEMAEDLVIEALHAMADQDVAEQRRCLRYLAEGPDGGDGLSSAAGRRAVDRAVLTQLRYGIGAAWRNGWQPADLVRVLGRRSGNRRAVRMAVDLIAAELRGYAAATVDRRWTAQLRTLGAEVWWPDDGDYLALWGAREGQDRQQTIGTAIEVLYTIGALPSLPVLGPLPGTARPNSLPTGSAPADASSAPDQHTDQRMLDRIRALLAKAESTDFPEEAEAYTAKAQELMARHSIDDALLAARSGHGAGAPDGIRIGIDNPYDQTKALLLQQVALANGSRAVWSGSLGFATVLGFPSDLDAIEMLYTSLLVQATTAMTHAGPPPGSLDRSRIRSFRQSFLTAYAVRIGERLQAATAQVVDEEVAAETAAAETAGSGRAGVDRRLLPVLAARDDAVDEATRRLFPELVTNEMRISNRAGWASGTAAADQASLHTRRPVSGEH